MKKTKTIAELEELKLFILHPGPIYIVASLAGFFSAFVVVLDFGFLKIFFLVSVYTV